MPASDRTPDFPLDGNEADVVEQATPADPGAGPGVADEVGTPLEATEADVAEQQAEVPLDDDAYPAG